MKLLLPFILLLSLVLCRDYFAMEVNELEPEDLDEFFSDESERYLVLALRGSQCTSCRWQMYYPFLLTYAFENENDMIFGAIDTDKAGRVATFCDVDPESAKLEIRLITKGGTRCIQYMEPEALTDFITEATGKIAKKSYVYFHNIMSFHSLKEKTDVSHFVEVMSPYERLCYDFSIQVEKAAEAFAMEPAVDFNRIDCSLTPDLCEELHVESVPGIMFLPAKNIAYNGTYPEVPTADGIIRFINQHLGTHRIIDGGLDDAYGRDAAFDLLAEEFATATEERRKEIMQQVKKERKQHLNSAIYYSVMKDLMANGIDAIFDRVNTTYYSILNTDVKDPIYAPTIAKINIMHQFEPIEPTRTIILSEQNIDRVLNGKRNVLVLFYDIRCPVCREFAQVYKDAFDKHPFSVYFASVNAARYESIRIRFNVTDHPVMKFFPADQPLENNIDIPERTAEGINDWLNSNLARIANEKKVQEELEALNLASQLDDDEEEEEVNVEEIEQTKQTEKTEDEL